MEVKKKHNDPFRTFFTVDTTLAHYMASLLKLEPNDCLLEPAAGDGHLLDAALKIEPHIQAVAYEIHPQHSNNLREKFGDSNRVDLLEFDTIFCSKLDHVEKYGPKFNKIIANPPYGGWQEHERRARLKKRYPEYYVKETYTLLLLRCLKLLEENGRLVFIIPDTFLYLHLQKQIRRLILEEFTIESIDIFKSSLFPGISFGYAGLCIISIRANQPKPSHTFLIRSVDSLNDLMSSPDAKDILNLIVQGEVLKGSSHTISISQMKFLPDYSAGHCVEMSELANCVTGFYSGNDKDFLRIASQDVKRSAGYRLVDHSLVEDQPSRLVKQLDGIAGNRHFVPMLKGGGCNFVKHAQWFVDWSQTSVAHYKRDKKARFQNSSYYFRKGIGLPMVTSTRATASIIDETLFDQSIVGVFPKNHDYFYFLLAYCNSPAFWSSLKAVNPSANSSAKYILKTTVVLPDEHVRTNISKRTEELIFELKSSAKSAKILQEEIISSITHYVKEKVSF